MASCAGPSDSARLASKQLKEKFPYYGSKNISFFAEMWFMPLEAFRLFVVGKDYEERFTVDAFNRICSVGGSSLPKDIVGKVSFVAPHVNDEDLMKCFVRVISAQTPPFSTMEPVEYNQMSGALFAQIKKRLLTIPEKWVLSANLDEENLKNLFDYQFGLFYKLGYDGSFSREMAALSLKAREVEDLNRVFAFVGKVQKLRPYLDRSCGMLGKIHEKGCKEMRRRYEGLVQVELAAQAAREGIESGQSGTRSVASEI